MQITVISPSTKKSGTSATARLALEYNREIGAVKGTIFSAMSAETITTLLLDNPHSFKCRNILKSIGKEVFLS